MEESQLRGRISAVIFDLDGTLLNTEQVTKDILKEFLAGYGKVQDSEKEKMRLGKTFEESAITVVTDYDLPLTPEQYRQEIVPMYFGKWQLVKPLPGADRLMRHLHNHGIPFALASNALRKNIEAKISYHDGWKERFQVIIGSDEVKSGKPAPDLFLEAAKRLGVDPSHCLVFEDSIVGVQAGKAAGMKVVTVPSLQNEFDSYSIADLILHSLLEFQPEQWGLPQFGDWINNVLPIKPINLAGVFTNGLLQLHPDSELPDQIWGFFIGWAKFDEQNIFKAVVSIGWSLSCGNKKIIKTHIIHGDNAKKFDSKMQLRLVGYLRRSLSEGNDSDMEIIEEDKVSGDAALELPEFSSQKSLVSMSHADLGNGFVH